MTWETIDIIFLKDHHAKIESEEDLIFVTIYDDTGPIYGERMKNKYWKMIGKNRTAEFLERIIDRIDKADGASLF